MGAVLLLAADLVALFLAFLCGHKLADQLRELVGVASRSYAFSDIPELRWGVYLTIAFGFVLWCWIAKNHYTRRKPFWDELREVLMGLAIAALIDAAMMFMVKLPFSRAASFSIWMSALLLVPAARRVARGVLERLGRWTLPTLIVGAGENAADALAALQSERALGYKVIGFVSVSGIVAPRVREYCVVHDLIILEGIEHLDAVIAKRAVGQLVLAIEAEQMGEQQQWIQRLTLLDTHLVVAPPLRGLPLYGTDTSYFFSHEVLLLRVRNNLARRGPQIVKRLFDIVAVLGGLAILAPLLLFVAWRIRGDGGPAIFKHKRVGRNGKEFKCYKFRSMVIDSDKRLKALLEASAEARAEWEQDHKLKNDPRITPLGRFIRKTSIDELPQLLNVLRGEMSLVGPRPIVDAEKAKYGDHLRYYLEACPGVTGLWQVSGRNDTDYSRRVMLDTWYVQNWSLWTDIVILFKTIRVVLRRDGAY